MGSIWSAIRARNHAAAVVLTLVLVVVPFALPSGAWAQSGADLLDRIQRLEAQNRTLNGQVEQLSNQNRQLTEQLRRLQGDLEFRLNELEQRGGARGGTTPPRQQPAPPQRQGRGDAFDPSQQASAPGAPRDLGGAPGANAAPARPSQGTGGGARPLDLGTLSQQAATDPTLQPGRGTGTPQIMQPSSRDEYDLATGYMQRREFDQAEQAFRNFIENHPRDRLVAEATHQLGESFYQRRMFREAAEHYLKVSTDFPRSQRAPSSLLRLGQSLNALGERDAACAAFAEANRKYPNAAPATRTALQNEQRRASC